MEDFTFQGINATKALAHVIGTKCMHIKQCTSSIDQAHISRYKELQKIKAAYNMADPHGNSPSKYHLLFGRKPSNSNNIAVLTSIKSIWDDDHIEKLEDNH